VLLYQLNILFTNIFTLNFIFREPGGAVSISRPKLDFFADRREMDKARELQASLEISVLVGGFQVLR
jgi:hypothetical protein